MSITKKSHFQFKYGHPLRDGVEIATFKYYDSKGFLASDVDLFYEKLPGQHYILDMGKYWHEFDEDGKIISSNEVQDDEKN